MGDGYWYFLVYDPFSDPVNVVARLNQSSAYQYPRIYGTQVTAEEGYTDDVEPGLPISYYFTHPTYSPNGVSYADWVGSGNGCDIPSYGRDAYPSTRDCLFVVDGNTPSHIICPYYAGLMNVLNDSRQWYGGVGRNANACGFTFF